MNRRVFTKIVLIYFLCCDFLAIVMSTRINYPPFVTMPLYKFFLLGILIQIIFCLIVFIPRLRALNKSLLWSVFALIPAVNFFYCIYLCIKKSDKDEIKENSMPTRKGMKRISYLLTLLLFLFLEILFQASSTVFVNEIITHRQLSIAMIDYSILTLFKDFVTILWCYFCLSKRLIDAGEDPYKAWMILVPFYNIYFLLKWCFVRSASA